MSKTVKMQAVVATATGFHGGQRKRRGDTFSVPEGQKARWFAPAGSVAAERAVSGKPNVAELAPADVQAALPSMTDREINDAISAEQGGKSRKKVLALMRDELANRVGKIGGPDPKAKQAEEKDPIVAGGKGAADTDSKGDKVFE